MLQLCIARINDNVCIGEEEGEGFAELHSMHALLNDPALIMP